jgi:hypothetical protein
MADMKIAENVEPLKKWDKLVKRNANGQFERGSKALTGAGRPPGSLNKTTTQLREAILGALEAPGGPEGSIGYLRRLAIENSSAFASLLGKVLPTTLAADESSGGLGVKMVFERHRNLAQFPDLVFDRLLVSADANVNRCAFRHDAPLT